MFCLGFLHKIFVLGKCFPLRFSKPALPASLRMMIAERDDSVALDCDQQNEVEDTDDESNVDSEDDEEEAEDC